MKPQSFDFKITGNHEFHGSAVILESHLDVKDAATKAFESDDVKLRLIGNTLGPDQHAYVGKYEIYESYIDSRSDYYYFAVMISSIAL